jgi:hypothetical protein
MILPGVHIPACSPLLRFQRRLCSIEAMEQTVKTKTGKGRCRLPANLNLLWLRAGARVGVSL